MLQCSAAHTRMKLLIRLGIEAATTASTLFC
jgi:hypothetical protein